ncbi:MAG: nucleotide pyrophosphohydrolase [Pseudomonadales bacterium]|jgi:NTP pyrophosphatase (non-canonical NTP hydrolase)|nr:nucleotide pyrophosphohydrolase [Pseudomonadales bacterium]
MPDTLIASLQRAQRDFARERDWEQFHTPKNLAMALTVEAAELQEIFQWLRADEASALSPAEQQHLREELADVLLYLCRLADVCNVDLETAAHDKLRQNAVKYPVDKVRGSAKRPADY